MLAEIGTRTNIDISNNENKNIIIRYLKLWLTQLRFSLENYNNYIVGHVSLLEKGCLLKYLEGAKCPLRVPIGNCNSQWT